MNNSLILIIVSGALINNVLLSRFWGVCSFLGVSKQMKASASLGVAVIFVMTIASAAGFVSQLPAVAHREQFPSHPLSTSFRCRVLMPMAFITAMISAKIRNAPGG